MIDEIIVENPELTMLKQNKQGGYNYQKRRHEAWKENYLLYRGTVKTNRITQRQSVTLPLMKMTIKTILKDLDDMPLLEFENLDNDKQAQIFQNEYWKWTLDQNSAEIKDVIDKRQEMLYGRTFDQWQIADGKILFTIEDPEDMLVDRYCDPADLDTSRFLIHTHIFKPLATLVGNDKYDQEAVRRLQTFYASKMGLIKQASNIESMNKKNEKLAELGVPDTESPVLGECYVELSMHFVYRENEKDKDGDTHTEQLWLYVEADNMEILSKQPLEEVIGVTADHYWQTHFPYNSWASDVERQDFWSDCVGDIIRPSNKLLNVWYSQLAENRTLRSFGMNYFDSTIEGFVPPSIEPTPWAWVGVPGKPTDVFQKIDIPDLTESIDEMQFILDMNDRATGATATQQGVQTERKVTLGEVQLALNEAKELNKGISKFYTHCWKKRGEKFLKLIEASPDKIDAVKLHMKGKNSNDIHTREVAPNDWVTKSGYAVKIWSQTEKDTMNTEQLQKIDAVSKMIPGNVKLTEALQKKALEFAGLNPNEIDDIIREEADKRQAMANNPALMGQPMPQPQRPLLKQ